jgi:hypothetical protein
MARDLRDANFVPHLNAFELLEDCVVHLMDSHGDGVVCAQNEHHQFLWSCYMKALTLIEVTYEREGNRIPKAALAFERMSMLGFIGGPEELP